MLRGRYMNLSKKTPKGNWSPRENSFLKKSSSLSAMTNCCAITMPFEAWSYVWLRKHNWGNRRYLHFCSGCRCVQNTSSAALVYPKNFLPKGWHQLHIDFAGLFKSAMFLIVVYPYSKCEGSLKWKLPTINATINTLNIYIICTLRDTSVSNVPQFW